MFMFRLGQLIGILSVWSSGHIHMSLAIHTKDMLTPSNSIKTLSTPADRLQIFVQMKQLYLLIRFLQGESIATSPSLSFKHFALIIITLIHIIFHTILGQLSVVFTKHKHHLLCLSGMSLQFPVSKLCNVPWYFFSLTKM